LNSILTLAREDQHCSRQQNSDPTQKSDLRALIATGFAKLHWDKLPDDAKSLVSHVHPLVAGHQSAETKSLC
jgi:hypothetical protein